MTPFRSTLLLLAASLAVALPSFGQDSRPSDSRPVVPVIRVTGQAEVSAEPDEATFEVGATITDPSSSKAMTEVARITDRIIAALRELNIPREDIETTQLYLNQISIPISNPQTEEERRGGYRKEYQAAHILQVKVGKSRFTQVGDILDAALKAGANHIGNIVFGLKDETAIRKDGLMKAVKDARSKADVMAEAAGVGIKGLLTLAEGGLPRPYEATFASMRTLAADAPAPVPPSQIRRTYTVSVEYAIRQ